MKFLPRSLPCLICLFLTMLASRAWADGIVFAKAVSTTTPDQRAMLEFSNGVERLVIETSYIGSGTNFAWVVPLPATPKVEAVSTNFFEYLNLAYQPRLISRGDDLGLWVGFLLLAVPITTGIWAWRRNGLAGIFWWLGLNGAAFFCLVVIVPFFVVARAVSAPAPASSVEVRNRQRVGIYDTVTLAGTNGSALVEWLNVNGFKTPATALPIISSYAAQGWVFMAATIHREAASDGGDCPHPLGFTFATAKPVYPLRLTGVDNPRCKIELFAFGPSRMEAPGFKVQYCGQPTPIEVTTNEPGGWEMQMDLFGALYPGDYKIGNEELRRWVFPGAVTTKLVGTLTAQDMQADAWPNWVRFDPTFPVLYSRQAANLRAVDWICGLTVPGLLMVQIVSPRLKRKTVIRSCLAILLLGIVGGWIRLATTDSTDVVYGGGPFHAQHDYERLEGFLEQEISEWTNGTVTDAKCLDLLNKYPDLAKNPFTGKPLRCEPTPGNITLQHSTNGEDVIWYDFLGIPHSVGTFPSK